MMIAILLSIFLVLFLYKATPSRITTMIDITDNTSNISTNNSFDFGMQLNLNKI